jgi:hypothetical protein
VEHLQWPRQPIGLILNTRSVALNVTLSLDLELSARSGHHVILAAALIRRMPTVPRDPITLFTSVRRQSDTIKQPTGWAC